MVASHGNMNSKFGKNYDASHWQDVIDACLWNIVQIMLSQFCQRVISTLHGEIERKYIHISRVFLINSSFFFLSMWDISI